MKLSKIIMITRAMGVLLTQGCSAEKPNNANPIIKVTVTEKRPDYNEIKVEDADHTEYDLTGVPHIYLDATGKGDVVYIQFTNGYYVIVRTENK